MTRRSFLALSTTVLGPLRAAEPRRPNIIVIVTDDLGYGDVSCYGSKEIQTPNIDLLAAQGVRFTDGYASSPDSSPTRAALLTGRYPQRFGHEYNFNPRTWCDTGVIDPRVGLPVGEVTLANALKSPIDRHRAEYWDRFHVAGAVGKWHLGMAPQFHPLRRGFEHFFGFLGQAHSYFELRPDENELLAERRYKAAEPQTYIDLQPTETRRLDGLRAPILRGYETVLNEEGYLTDLLTREALRFIQDNQKRAFFLYLAYNAPHTPLQAPKEYLARFANLRGPRQVYAAMVSAVDAGVGAILGKLKESGIEQDTLIFFLSDNGGAPADGGDNGALRGGKNLHWEGGIRVPFLMQWRSRVPGGKVYPHPVIVMDIFTTAVAAGGGELPSRVVDGVDLVPYVTGEKAGAPHDFLFWRQMEMYKSFESVRAARQGKWKWMKIGEQRPQLYDLAEDLGESRDIAGEHSAIVEEISGAVKQWEAQLSWPRWRRICWERP